MLWSGEYKLQEQNNTTETPIGEEQEEKMQKKILFIWRATNTLASLWEKEYEM